MIEKLINRIGLDRIAHFGIGRDLITTPLGWAVFGIVFAILAGLFVWWVIRFNRKGGGGK